MIDQFGPEGGWACNLANGRDDRHLTPLKHQETVTERTSLPFSSTSLEMLPGGGGHTAAPSLRPPCHERTVRRQDYPGVPVYGTAPWEKTINFRAGIGQWEKASFIVRSQLEAEPPEVPIDGLSLTLSNFTGESGSQLGLLPDVRESAWAGWRKRNGGYSRRRREPPPCTGWSRSLRGTPRRRCGQYRRRWSL